MRLPHSLPPSAASATAVAETQIMRSRMNSPRLAAETLSPLAAAETTMSHWSSLKAASSFPTSSGSPLRKAASSAFEAALPLAKLENIAPASWPEDFRWACRAATTVCTTKARRNGDLSSAKRGAATSPALLTSACSPSKAAVVFCTRVCATKRCSLSVHFVESFASSTWHCVSRLCSLASSAVMGARSASAKPLASWTRCARYFLASVTAACASSSACATSSHMAQASSGDILSTLSSPNLPMVSASFWTAASTLDIFSPEACIWLLSFLCAVSFLSSLSLVARPSSFFWQASSSFVQASAGPSEKALASPSFWMTKVRASVMAFCASCAAASQAAMALRASLEANASIPLRNGSSSSVQRWTALSAFSTFSTAEAIRSAVSSLSRCSFAVAITLSSFLSAAEHLARMAESSSFRTPWAVLSLTSTSLAVVLSLVLHETMRLSRRSTLSADGASPPCGTTSAATLSTSPSVVRRRFTTSASICFTRRRSSASFVALRSLMMSCCMLFTLVCSRPSSLPELAPAIANFFSSAVLCRRCFRAATMLACAARSARLACSTASCAPSATVSPGAPMLESACVASIIFCTSDSADETLFSTSSRRCVRFRSAVLARNCCNRSRPSSMRFCSASISSFTDFAGPSVKRATSTIFLAMKVCASDSEMWTFVAIWSASAMSVSRFLPPCSPLRNGSSASAMT
mmetsp:Transcript_63794/g.167048  ORF Transcript_63794/g.167048 Transcript_63794/m.167048 type:complete len:695 (-) Transcript_63794:322-2406(-)